MRDFRDCLTLSGLFDLPFQGPHFTWSNHRAGEPIAKKLDRCLVNGQWLFRFPASHCSFEPPEFSDHSPGFIRLLTPRPSFGSRPFRFFNLLTKHQDFKETIQFSWNNDGESAGNLRDFCFKLKQLKRPLRSLLKDNYSAIERRVAETASILSSRQMLSLNDQSEVNLSLEAQAKDIWQSLRLAEESFFKLRSRIKWLGEGDLNTKFFHSVTTARNAKNAIKHLLRPDGSRTTTLQEVHEVAVAYYQSFLTTIRGDFSPDLPRLLESLIENTCSLQQQGFLSLPFNSEMVRRCLFKMPLNKTPGPDGFPVEFFKASWDVLGTELEGSVLKFFEANFIPTSLNATSLVLIPKRPGAEELKDFPPIACLNTVYKLITKLLSERLKLVMSTIIAPNQTAFVKDRLLLENVLLASEIMQDYHREVIGRRITLKIDISKAFDSVRWDFLLNVLASYHIPDSFSKWVRCCGCNPSLSVSINGITSGYFRGKTGLRQGDPLSPILFVMVMNVLSQMLNRAAKEGTFSYHPGCEELQLTHLCFADDLLIFLEGSERSLRGVLSVISDFERISGLGINIQKTSMFCQGLDDASLANIQDRFSLRASSLPISWEAFSDFFCYLGNHWILDERLYLAEKSY
ncbi:unnamed protein product [Microthlaspi erraticum]|uniref:Reverse transcriptase domain-containing protein n=1 Tax=Microthlaspi erraticum TaxID=1685480 RepID=A0A6D2KUW3_9BRAS|nr:unnamed protein product [Microthlaspi erraticum]